MDRNFKHIGLDGPSILQIHARLFWRCFFLSLLSIQAHSSSGQPSVLPSKELPPTLTLTLAPGDHPALLKAILTFSQAWNWELSPVIVAMEPGPLILKDGLKLLPNEIPPRLTVPNILIISTLGALNPDLQFIAFVRRVLSNGGSVWVVGDSFPEDLASMPLSPGQEIRLLQLHELDEQLSRKTPPSPMKWPPLLIWR